MHPLVVVRAALTFYKFNPLGSGNAWVRGAVARVVPVDRGIGRSNRVFS
jgi:hypothetical protein